MIGDRTYKAKLEEFTKLYHSMRNAQRKYNTYGDQLSRQDMVIKEAIVDRYSQLLTDEIIEEKTNS